MFAVVFSIFFVSLVVGIPIAFALYFSSFSMLLWMHIPDMIMVQRMIGAIEKYPLLCIPFFILAGSLMSAGGITQRLIYFANLLVGRFRGALGLVNVVASMFFSGISGSAVADATSIGSIMIPTMKKEGYDPGFCSAITASAAVCGPIIPPSIPMVVFGIVTAVPIGRLFLAGAIPGFLYGGFLLIGAYVAAVRNNYPKHEPASFKQVVGGIKYGASALAMPLIIIAGVATGVVTDAEIGALAALYALFVGIFVHRELNVSKIIACLKETVISTAIVLFIMGAANLFSWLLSVSGAPQMIVASIFQLTENKWLILLMLNVLLLIIGCFIDGVPAILLLAPILLPLVMKLGIDPVHFGVIFVFNMMVGNLTPPVGLTLLVTLRFSGVSLLEASRAVIPYLMLALIVLALITIFPWFSLFLPNLFY